MRSRLGDRVEAGEVLAHHGDERDPTTELEELNRSPRHRHRLPPAQTGVQRPAEVVLEDLPLVERPAVVLVLAVVPPLPAELDAEMHKVSGQLACRVRRVLDPCHESADTMAGEDRFEFVDDVAGHDALGQHDHVDNVDFVERRGEDTVDEVEIESLGGNELEEAERLALGSLGRRLPWSEVAVPDPQRPRQQQDVGRLTPRIEAAPLRRYLVPLGADTWTTHTCVAREGAQRDAAGGRQHLRQDAQARQSDPRQRSGAGEQLASPTAQRAAGAGGTLDGDAHAGTGLVGQRMQREQRRTDPPVATFGE